MGAWECGNVGTPPDSRAVHRFEDIDVLRPAHDPPKDVYRAAQPRRLTGDWPLRDQTERTTISSLSTVAEECERGTRKQQVASCCTAKGSAVELRSQVIWARQMGLLDDAASDGLVDRCDRVLRQLSGYLKHVQNSQRRIRDARLALGAPPGKAREVQD